MVVAFADIGKTFLAIITNRLKMYKDSTDVNENENETK
jgi:hypothetical protein